MSVSGREIGLSGLFDVDQVFVEAEAPEEASGVVTVAMEEVQERLAVLV